MFLLIDQLTFRPLCPQPGSFLVCRLRRQVSGVDSSSKPTSEKTIRGNRHTLVDFLVVQDLELSRRTAPCSITTTISSHPTPHHVQPTSASDRAGFVFQLNNPSVHHGSSV